MTQLTKEEIAQPFTQQEIEAAKATRDEIIANDISVLKGIYMAGEIVMWNEIQAQLKSERERAGKLMEALEKCVKEANEIDGSQFDGWGNFIIDAETAINEYNNKP